MCVCVRVYSFWNYKEKWGRKKPLFISPFILGSLRKLTDPSRKEQQSCLISSMFYKKKAHTVVVAESTIQQAGLLTQKAPLLLTIPKFLFPKMVPYSHVLWERRDPSEPGK